MNTFTRENIHIDFLEGFEWAACLKHEQDPSIKTDDICSSYNLSELVKAEHFRK